MQKTLIIIPCYNEEKRINLSEFRNHLLSDACVEFLFVNDGSSDNTGKIIEDAFKNTPAVNLLNLDRNRGKANAVRSGMLWGMEKNYHYIGYWDADLSTPLYEIKNFIRIFQENPHIDIVFGCRVKRLGSKIIRNTKRHYLGRIFSTLVTLLTTIEVYDSQCGAKMFRRHVCKTLFAEPFLSEWIFDVEILARYMKNHGKDQLYSSIYELPLQEWKDIKGSKLNFLHMINIPGQLLKIRSHYLLK